jgi:DNA repair protein RadC
MSLMPHQSAANRYTRLQTLLDALTAREKFTVAQLRTSCPNETAAFITRHVHELQRQGHLQTGDDKSFTWTCDPRTFPAQTWLERKVYAAQLTQTPAADRPRERLLAHGAAALRTAELLALLIRSGRPGESALQAGERIAARYGDQLDRLADAGPGELQAVTAALGPTAFCQIMAGIELGRRVAQATNEKQHGMRSVQGSDQALRFCRDHFARLATDAAHEEFHIVCLDTKLQVVGTHQVSVGLLDRSIVHPREVFRPAIKDAAKAIILVHNHPSGDPVPSEEDLTLTSRLEEAGKTIGIQVLDHIIVARTGATSIGEFRKSIA